MSYCPCFIVFALLLGFSLIIYSLEQRPVSINAFVRRILFPQVTLTSCIAATTFGSKVVKAEEKSVREKLGTIASKIPGYGERDIFYPQSFIGTWTVNELITSFVSDADNLIPAIYMLDKQSVGAPFAYQLRFVSSSDGSVVNDRSFSLSSEYSRKMGGSKALSFWQADNPNTARTVIPDQELEVATQISKRSVEQFDEGNTAGAKASVGFSEFFRVAELSTAPSAELAAPRLYAVRILERLQQVDYDSIVGVVRKYVYPMDTLDSANVKPVVVIKSKLLIKRLSE